MGEVDDILLHTLGHLGCDVGDSIAELSPVQLINCVTKCLQLSKNDADLPDFDTKVSMSARYKVASEIAQHVSDLGYTEDIGCQTFLYPTETETRKLLIFLVEKLPRESDIGDQIETLLSKLAHDSASSAKDPGKNAGASNGTEVDGIRLPASVDVDSLPKETLKFYASHLADISFAKQREKYRNKPLDKPPVPETLSNKDDQKEESDEFVDPSQSDAGTDQSECAETISSVPAKSHEDNVNSQSQVPQEVNEQRLREEETKNLQSESKTKSRKIKQLERDLRQSEERKLQLLNFIEKLKEDIESKQKTLDRLKKTDQLLSGEDDALQKVKTAVNGQMEKLVGLSKQWEAHRKPLVDEIFLKSGTDQMSETSLIREEVKHLKSKLKEMGQDAKRKEVLLGQLMVEYEKLPKDLNRSSYTKRIIEIIGNIKKQKREIAKVLGDTKEIQKDINMLTGRLDRSFAVADELIYKDAERDKNIAVAYKLLVTIHSDFSRIINSLEETGNHQRHQRDLQDKLDLERGKGVEDKLARLKADLSQMQMENKILEAKLRDPTLSRNK